MKNEKFSSSKPFCMYIFILDYHAIVIYSKGSDGKVQMEIFELNSNDLSARWDVKAASGMGWEENEEEEDMKRQVST